MFIQHKTYTYDALNHRITRTGKDGTTHYAYGRNGALTYEKNLSTGVTREYAYLNDQIIGWTEKDASGNKVKRYAVTDLLGSVTAVTDFIERTEPIIHNAYDNFCLQSLVQNSEIKSNLSANNYLKSRKDEA